MIRRVAKLRKREKEEKEEREERIRAEERMDGQAEQAEVEQAKAQRIALSPKRLLVILCALLALFAAVGMGRR